jgi:hypothetical protein
VTVKHTSKEATPLTSTFGEMVGAAMGRKGWGDYQLSAAIGLLSENRVVNNTQVRRLRTGGRRHLDRELVARLIEVLELDPAEAWPLAGLWPPDLDVTTYREARAKVSPPEPALAHATGGSDTPPASSLRKAPTPLRTEGRRRDNSCYSYLTGHRRRLLEPAHIGQRVAA